MKKILTVVFLLSVSIFAQPTVETWIVEGGLNGISDNGLIACGYDAANGQGFYWTETGGKVYLGVSEAFGVSNDTTIAGRFLDPNTITNGNPTWVAGYYKNGVWTKLSGIPGIDPLDEQSYTHAYSINADGTRITGMVWEPGYKVEACNWSIPDTGIGLLGRTNNGSSRADDISNDGSMIVGWNGGLDNNPDRTPYYWDPAPHFMGSFDPNWDGGECNGISPDGNILVGISAGFAFRYTQAQGMQMIVDPVIYSWGSWCSDVSNTDVIVGHLDEGFFTYRSFIKLPQWSEVTETRSYLLDTLQVTGYDDWYFLFTTGISADGEVTVGTMANDTYQFGVGYVMRIKNIVPVELASFTADVHNSSVTLNWQTATETNNSGFEIERKSEQSDWQKLGFAAGSGTTAETRNYSFYDNNLSSGKYFYRLKQLDYDGTFEYSKTIEVEISAPAAYSLEQNYPNPFNPTTTIKYSLPEANFVTLAVYNSLGEKVSTLVNQVVEAGNHTLEFNAENLSSGIYFVRMEAGSFISTKKITLMK